MTTARGSQRMRVCYIVNSSTVSWIMLRGTHVLLLKKDKYETNKNDIIHLLRYDKNVI